MASNSNEELPLAVKLSPRSATALLQNKIRNGKKLGNKKVIDEIPLLDIEQQATARKENKGQPFNYDHILELHIGQFGKFQKRTLFWLCLAALLHGPVLMITTFTGAVPAYR